MSGSAEADDSAPADSVPSTDDALSQAECVAEAAGDVSKIQACVQ